MPIGVAVAGAKRNARKLVRATIENVVVERPEPTVEEPQGMGRDKGDDYAEVRATLLEFG